MFSKDFTKKIIATWGDKGQQWLASLPVLVDSLAQKWQLTHLQPVKNLSYNYVLTAQQTTSGSQVVLKIGLELKEIHQEISALLFYDGKGCVRLLNCDLQRGAFLLEFISPGVSLKKAFPFQDDEAISHAAAIIKLLHTQKSVHSIQAPTIADWLKALNETKSNLIPKKHLIKAKTLSSQLLNSQSSIVLLHGDLHHENILSSTDKGWVAIDPKGVLGEPAYEVGAFIRNPFPELLQHKDAESIIAHRLDAFSKLLGFDRQRLKEWSYAQAVLAACWSQGDTQTCTYFLQCADLIEKV